MTQDDSQTNKPEKPSSGGVSIHIGRDVNGSQVVGAGGDILIEGGMRASSERNEVAEAFKDIYQKIEARPADSGVEKTEIVETVKKIETEVQKGEAGNASIFEKRLKVLMAMAPDIAEVVAATVANPIAGISTVIKKIAEKAKSELAASPGSSGD